MLPPINLNDLHGAVGAGSGGVIYKQSSEALLEYRRIIISEARFLRELHIDRTFDLIQPELNKMLLTHCVGGAAALFGRLTVNTLCDLNRTHFNGRSADRLMDRNRASDSARSVAGRFEGEDLAERAHIEPKLTGLGGVLILILDIADAFDRPVA